jgi:hypothetical protein
MSEHTIQYDNVHVINILSPLRWLRFLAKKTRSGNKINCAVSWRKIFVLRTLGIPIIYYKVEV